MADARAARRPRQSDIARLARVSQAAVSWVVNDRVGKDVRIKAETRQRILDAIDELGYVVDPVARSLAGGRNKILGVYTFQSLFPLDSRDFYYPFLVGIEEEAEAQGYDLLLFTSATGRDGHRRIYQGNTNRLLQSDGCILLGREEDKTDLARLVADGFRFVFVGRREVPDGELSYASADYASGTAEVIGHLADLGHRRIAYLPKDEDGEPAVDRDAGFARAVAAHGLDDDPALTLRVADGQVSPAQIDAVLAQEPTAIVAHEASVVRWVRDAAAERGLRVPRDLSLAVLEDPSELDGHKAFTGFHIPRREMGAEAVRLLISQLDAPDPERQQVALPCPLQVGASTARAPHQHRTAR